MMNREETDLNENSDTTCFIYQNVGSSGVGSSANNTPLFISMVKAEMDDIKPEFRLECLTCRKIFTNREDIDFHDTTSCQMIEDDVMSTSEMASSDSRFILNTNEECDKSTSGRAENTVEMSVVHLSIECSKATMDNVTSPSHVPHQTSYEIENIDGMVLGVAVDEQVAEGIPLPPKKNASSSTEKSKFLEIKLSNKLNWIPCQFCGKYLPTQAKLEYHIACRHYSPKIFDDTFDDRDQADKEKEAEGSDVQFVMEEEIFIQPDVRMTRWFQCETCHEFVFSEDDLLRHSCRSNPKGQENSRSLEETDEDEDWIGASNFGEGKDDLVRETEKDADQGLTDRDILNDPYDLDLEKGEEENNSERNDPQLPILSKSRPFKTSQKSQKTNANCINGKTRGKRGISGVQKETCDLISRRSERLLKRLVEESEKGQISFGLLEQESHSKNMHPSSLNRKSRGKQVLLSKENEGNSNDNEEDDIRGSSHCKQIRKSRRTRKLCSDSSTSIKVNSRESRTRKSNKGVSKLSSENGNETDSPGSRETRPNEKYKHQCTECFKWFQGKSNLQNHMRSHTGEKPFECATCFGKFTREDNLKRHQIVHDGIKPFECDICRRQFTQKNNLKMHRKRHTRVLPLKCRFCPLKFSDQFYLIPHERLHMGPRPFKCGQCSATFSTNTNLKRHQLSHTGQRPYKCDQCSATYTRKENWQRHKCHHRSISS